MAIAEAPRDPVQRPPERGLRIERHFTREGVHPYDEIEWELRDAIIPGEAGNVFEQRGVEVPKFWSQTATNVVASKYFRGKLGTPQRETSVKQMVDRVVDTIARAGFEAGYFASEPDRDAFADELKFLMVNQHASFNSPVWFNIGTSGRQVASACFILSVEDDMHSILDWFKNEGIIFKGGSGSGVNVSAIRSAKEQLSGGGYASGPVSFMRGADSVAGSIKSGGTTRRAAKMVVLNADHPDIHDFIWCKAKEEQKAWALGEQGYDMSLNGEAWQSIQFQNANNSVRVTDDFMKKALAGEPWSLTARTTGEALETLKARDLLREIADAAWACGDPGMQFDTTINDWHTSPASGRINGSNPCFPGDARVHTTKGLLPIADLFERTKAGEDIEVYTHRATAEEPSEGVVASLPLAVMRNGTSDIVRLRFTGGRELRCTPNHRIWTTNRGWVEARDLSASDRVLLNDSPTPAEAAAWELPVRVGALAKSFHRGGRVVHQELPTKWSEPLAEMLGYGCGDGWLTDVQVGWVYGGDDIADGLLDWHERIVTDLVGGVSRQAMDNGTVQLRVGSSAVRELFGGLGMTDARAPQKSVPFSIFRAPSAIQSAFLRGLFTADGTFARAESKSHRYVGLGSTSPKLLRDVQRLLHAFGIRGRIYPVRSRQAAGFAYKRKNGESVTYASSELYDLRITGSDLVRFADSVGFASTWKQSSLRACLDSTEQYRTKSETRLLTREFDGQAVVYNLNEPIHHSYIVDGFVVANCSEYMHIDDSACNLASLNLMRFTHADGEFDVARFARAVDVIFTAQEILVGFCDYPTEKITKNAKAHRQLGLGYANLGALLMARGLPYDSNEGRAYAAAITALMTGEAYTQSARIAEIVGPFEAYPLNKTGHDRVMEMHRQHAYRLPDELLPPTLLSGARQAWDDAVELGKKFGYRNAQASVIAPTGTISFMLGADTTGIEPEIALVKYKKLVGGGTLKLVNGTVPGALQRLGYTETQVGAVATYIEQYGTIEGAPALKDEHLPVFDCAFKAQNGVRSIHYMGHIKMMGAVQPFISGAISKCVTADTLLSTAQGLVRIGTLHRGEAPDSFRGLELGVVSLDGMRSTDAFYYGGARKVLDVRLRSGHRVTGTPNHRLLIAGMEEGLVWRRLDQLKPGDHVATQYGEDIWATQPASLRDFRPSIVHGSQKSIRVPSNMTEDLAFFLGAYAAEGHITPSNWTIHISNADEEVIARLQSVGESLFGLQVRVARQSDRCPCLELSSKTLVELFEHLGCGHRASSKRIPDVVLRSPRAMVLAFISGLSLDSYMPSSLAKWAICLDSCGLLDDLQAVLTNLGVVHSRITKYNAEYGKYFDEVSAHGPHAQALVRMLDFPEAQKRERGAQIASAEIGGSWADVVPGVTGRNLYELLPKGRGGRAGRGTGVARRFSYLKDGRTATVSRASLVRVAAVPGTELPPALRMVLERNLHFSPVVRVSDGGIKEVFDVSVPSTHAFVGNGIVNHNTVNLPETAKVDDVMDAYVEAWKHGVKAIAVYRDGSKKVQPVNTTAKDANEKRRETVVTGEPVVARTRRRLPDTRASLTHKFTIEGHEGYITVGLFEDGTPGELFVTMAKEGSTLSGMMDAFATSISLLFQYGVPLSHLVEKFGHMRFEPSGWTGNSEIGFAKSIVDYVFRWLGHRFLSAEDKALLGMVRTTEVADPAPQLELLNKVVSMASSEPKAMPTGPGAMRLNSTPDAPPCPRCGWLTVRNGTCHKCENCGETTGCS